jgi:DNA polymerase III delta subunit
MTLIDLKKFITDKIVPSDFMIFVSKDCPFLVSQYVKALGDLSISGINKINSIYEPQQSSIMLITNTEEALNVLYTDTFDERSEDYSQFENTIVVCEQVSKDIAKNVENYVIKFPKLEEWQICDYAKILCSNIEESDLMWLIQTSGNDIERIINELDKVALFDKNEQKEIFSAIQFDPQSDLYKVDLFTVVNALVEGDLMMLYDFMKHNGYDVHEPVVLVNRALMSLKNIILVTKNPQLSAEALGVTEKQKYALMRKYQSLNENAVRQKLKFLTNFDLMLKTSQLELNKRDMMNYIINNMYYRITN